MRIFGWIFLFLSALLHADWTHLELGAGNYGTDGHTQASQRMTVLQKVEKLSEREIYIDELEEEGTGDYDPNRQFAVLFWTLDELVLRHGPRGPFYVNDLYAQYAEAAAGCLREHAEQMGYEEVLIEVLAGDYEALAKSEGRGVYDSVHLKNPEVSLFHDAIDGNQLFTSEETKKRTRALLQSLAGLAREGLFLFILDHPNFFPEAEEDEPLYHDTGVWPPVAYIFPEGEDFPLDCGRVFWIAPPSFPPKWAHLELGAGNYGIEGQLGDSRPLTERQYTVLYQTVDELVERYGPHGVIHLNDLDEAIASFACEKLQRYADEMGYDRLVIETAPGDFCELKPELLLSQYGKTLYESVHLKNPEPAFFMKVMGGYATHVTKASRQRARLKLQKMANYGSEGLYFFVIAKPEFFPRGEQVQFASKELFYLPTDEWPKFPYYSPEGDEIPTSSTEVYFIPRQSAL